MNFIAKYIKPHLHSSGGASSCGMFSRKDNFWWGENKIAIIVGSAMSSFSDDAPLHCGSKVGQFFEIFTQPNSSVTILVHD